MNSDVTDTFTDEPPVLLNALLESSFCVNSKIMFTIISFSQKLKKEGVGSE